MPVYELDFWRDVLRNNWDIDAFELRRLAGEYDLNFLAKCKSRKGFILKVMRLDCPEWLVEVQTDALKHIIASDERAPVPRVIVSSGGADYEFIPDEMGNARLVWVLEELDGQCYADFAPKSAALAHHVGQALARTAKALSSFPKLPHLHREDFKWNPMQSSWITEHISCLTQPSRKAIISQIVDEFNEIELDSLNQQVIHNDANDYNILVSRTLTDVSAQLIDFGDMCIAPRVCDVGTAAAYMVLGLSRPEHILATFVAGYHSIYPLQPQEVDLIWKLLRMRLAVSLVNSTMMANERPDDPYVTITTAPAWRFLEGQSHLSEGLITARLRAACNLPVVDGADRTITWLDENRGTFSPLFGFDIEGYPVCSLSVEESVVPSNPFELSEREAAEIGSCCTLGSYNEPRLIYTDPAFSMGPWKASDRRTVHLGVDVFSHDGSALYAPFEGIVFAAEYRPDRLDYGGVIILQHETSEKDVFFTLYGHLDPSSFLDTLRSGDLIRKGEKFCTLGAPDKNGGWSPHVHFQLALSTLDMGSDLPGVGAPDDMYLWRRLCPNPAALLNLPEERTYYMPTDKAAIQRERKAHFGGNLSLSYNEPLMLVRGWKHHLFDEWGRPYLDGYNNVPHVGHAHPRIAAVASLQLQKINTNTRYLHRAQTELARNLLSKLPDSFEVCYFVNSGSEANELALRLARAYSGCQGVVTPDNGYFGNTTGAISISAYKFNKPNGIGQANWVELVEVADDFRGSFKREDPNRAEKYANMIDEAMLRLESKGCGVSCFIAETFPSVAGQIIPPKGYLETVYKKVREKGALCIADEVQTGLGRLGKCYFGFEDQEVCPDIVVLGKPIANGHPLAVVCTTKEVAQRFDNGIEFFSTFGGSTLSCMIGKEVLDIIEEEGLQENARLMGDALLEGLRRLQSKYPAIIGDVRGMGLFIGVDLMESDGSESTARACYVKNRMRDHRILIGCEGPKDNILKIRPPLTIAVEDVEMIITTLDCILDEFIESKVNETPFSRV